MSNNPPESYADDFLEQILAIPSYSEPVDTSSDTTSSSVLFPPPMFPLNLNLDSSSTAETAKTEGEPVLFPPFGLSQSQSLPVHVPRAQQVFHGQPIPGMGAAAAALQPPANRPRVRARRGQATDPHSIAERVRRERIAERLKALQELVPSCNKTDRAAMLDEIVDYVKFLRLQVKVLSMSRLGGAGAVAQLVADTTLPPVEQGVIEGGTVQQPWDTWSDDVTEGEVANLMEQDVGSAMQFLHSKALCIMPISLAATIFPATQVEPSTHVKSEPNIPL